MLTQKITEEEIEFLESWFDPICLSECLYSNFDDLGEFEPEIFGEIRKYQVPMLSHESLFDFDAYEDLSEKERFQLRKNVGDVINVGARKYGKTLITLRLDISLSSLYDDRFPTGLYSIDEKRLRGVLDAVKLGCEHHPIMRMWNIKCSYKPEIKFYGNKNHWMLKGVNMTIRGKDPGYQFYQMHVKKLWGEEVSFETKEIYDKRKEALSELGAVIRLAGMTDFTSHSPIGIDFNHPRNKNKIINYPQYVNRLAWDKKERQDRLEAYGGTDSVNYRVFVEGEIVADGIAEFDMDRVRKCYYKHKEIKTFEIPKDRFKHFRNMVVVERPKNADRIFIASDVGDKVTEIIIVSEVDAENKYNYLYNIVLYNLKKDEQLEVFQYLIEKLEANVIAIDCGDAMGRILCDDFEKLYKKENVVRYAGASKVDVGFLTDEKGHTIIKNGVIQCRREYMSEWSVSRLKVLLYEERIRLPIDWKLELVFNAVISMRSGDRVMYKAVSENEHFFDAWRVLSIAQWLKKDFNQTKPMSSEWATGAKSW